MWAINVYQIILKASVGVIVIVFVILFAFVVVFNIVVVNVVVEALLIVAYSILFTLDQ